MSENYKTFTDNFGTKEFEFDRELDAISEIRHKNYKNNDMSPLTKGELQVYMVNEIKHLTSLVEVKLSSIEDKIESLTSDLKEKDNRLRELENKSFTLKGYFLGLGILLTAVIEKLSKFFTT
jgi:hypothetical protein